MPDLSLKQFTAIDRTADAQTYVAALEAFDEIEQLQELKALARDLAEQKSLFGTVGYFLFTASI